MKVAIVGYGIEGKISAQYWHGKGDEVTICEQNAELDIPTSFTTKLGDDSLKNLHEFEVIVRTAGLHPRKILEANADHPEIKDRITTSLDEFIKVCPTKQIIGVTGTKGKGTTSTLAAKILAAADQIAHVGGNIGLAPLELLTKVQPNDWVILEISSFQLIDFKQRVANAVCLSVTQEHLNWHADLAEYIEAKTQLFRHQTAEDRAIYNADSDSAVKIAGISLGTKIPFSAEASTKDGAYVDGDSIYWQNQVVCQVSDVALPGRYNLQNVCAAIAAVWPFINGNTDAVMESVKSFTGLEHHFEPIGDIDGVKYIDDSYATAQDATIEALTVYKQPTVLILGGAGKNVAFDPMIDAVVAAKVKHVVLVGKLAEEFKQMLAQRGYTNVTLAGPTMTEIVEAARAQAQAGDIILLSPGCASKPEFIDNVDRGNQFKQVVGRLRDQSE